MRIRDLLNQHVGSAMTAAGIPVDCLPQITPSTRPEFGDFQANGVLGAAKKLGVNPRELAQSVIDNLDLGSVADELNIAGPGFINIRLSHRFLSTALDAVARDQRLGITSAQPVQTVVVDYSSPNLAKEMHVGHLRSTIIGDAVTRVLEYLGQRVIRQNHMGDWGTQFGMLIAELEEKLGKDAQPELALKDLELFYQQAKQHFDADAVFAEKARQYVVKLQSGDSHCLTLWQQFIDISTAHSEALYRQLNVTLGPSDVKPESAYNAMLSGVVSDLENQGLAQIDQGATVVFVPELADKNGNPSPVIVKKSDGGYLYATTDLAALQYRCATLHAERVMYFIDARQSLHMQQIFVVARKAGYVPADVSLEHLPFGTMMGEDGKPFKTRAGGTVKLANLLHEAVLRAENLIEQKNPDLSPTERREVARKVGIGAVKYADLSKTRTVDYVFNWSTMLSFEGNTAPYLQYAYTRIRSIFRKAEAIGGGRGDANIVIAMPAEKTLSLALLKFDETLHQVASQAYPHILCAYLYELASAYMTFYEHCPILASDVAVATRDSRLRLCDVTARTLAVGLELLGIEVMERM